MKILMAASECVPFIKVGGLADIVGVLPRFLKDKKHDVRIVVPKYRKIDEKKFGLKALPYRMLIPIGDRCEEATIKEGKIDGKVPVYFVENKKYFDRGEIYRTAEGDYEDNRERFIFFSRAVLETAKAVCFQPDIIHCHDWQTGLIPAYLNTVYKIDSFFNRTAAMYTIHNIAYQGNYYADTMNMAGFSWKDFSLDKLEYYGNLNFMKSGLVYANTLSTVSPTYSKEIQTEDGGRGMEGILKSRAKDVYGIINGIDYQEWSPQKDNYIASGFSQADLKGKAECKKDLQKSYNLPANPNIPLIGSISRLDPQKGYDLVDEVMPELMKQEVQVVILGTGDKEIQDCLSGLAKKYPEKFGLKLEFNNALAHKIYAGSDLFLMPSRFEPCGLGQMISLAYGTIPIVNKTGGLADSIEDFSLKSSKGNGFVFSPAKTDKLKEALDKAVKIYKNKAAWKKLVANAFKSDFSWARSVNEYIKLYTKTVNKKRK